MATLSKSKKGSNGFWLIQFFDEHRRRKAISLSESKFSEKTANEVKTIVETLMYYRVNNINVPDKRTEHWVLSACPEIREKLTKVGLIELPPTHTCGELWEAFLKTKTGIKDTTLDTYENALRRFFVFFNKGEYLDDLTPTRMTQWKTFLLTEAPRGDTPLAKRTVTSGRGLAEATVAGTLTKAKAAFNWAKENGWIEKSPLEGIGRGSFVNRKNDRFITRDEYLKLLDRCPCQEWRVILALARYGGLRCPSEVLRLRWSDIDWERDRFHVSSSKTEHHRGKEGRMVPLFADVRQELNDLFFRDESEGTEFVINRYRDPERSNLGTQFARIVKMAGISPVKRPYDNMRASRSNEIYAEFGPFYESQWIGHSSKVAKDHYLNVTDADFSRAAAWSVDRTVRPSAGPLRPEPKRVLEPEPIEQ